MPDSAQLETRMPPEVLSPEDVRLLSGRVAGQHGFVTSADQTRLFYRFWPALEPWNGRTVIVFHGIGYHSGPYKVIADALNPVGTDVYALDARGHGLSQGRRGFLGTPAQVVEDIASIVQLATQHRASTRIFLLGDSMGADFVLAYAKDNGSGLSGMVLMALALNLDMSQFLSLESLSLMPYFALGRRQPVIDLVGQRLEESSRHEEFIASRRIDPLAYKNVSFGYLMDVQRLVFGWRWRIAPRVHAPTLLVKGGQDRVVSHSECVAFDRLCASKDKNFKIYPDVPHTTLWDPQTPEILDLVGNWILQR